VAGVLLDHSEQYLAQRHRPSATAVLIQGIVGGDVETGSLGHEPRAEVHLRLPCLPCLRNHLGVGNSTIEITVTVGVGHEQPRHIVPGHQLPECCTFHLGEVSHQSQERHRRRLDGTSRHGLRVKTCTLHF